MIRFNGWFWPASLLLLFLLLTFAVAIGATQNFDDVALAALDPARIEWILTAAIAISVFGYLPANAILVAVAAVGLYAYGRIRAAGYLLLASLIAPFGLLIKNLIARQRPVDLVAGNLRLADGYSYPSGHVVFYTAVFGFLFVLAGTEIRSEVLSKGARIVLLALIVAVGLDRLLESEHWPTDVIGGYLLALACLSLVTNRYLSQRR